MHNHVTPGPVLLQHNGQYGENVQRLVGEEFKAEQEIAPQEIKQSVHQEPFIVNKEIAMMIRVQLMVTYLNGQCMVPATNSVLEMLEKGSDEDFVRIQHPNLVV